MAMKMLRFGCLLISSLLASHARADSCQLLKYGTLPVEMFGGRATTMVKINGKDTRFALDTGAVFNFMSRANGLSLGLNLRAAPFCLRMSGVGGATAHAQTKRCRAQIESQRQSVCTRHEIED